MKNIIKIFALMLAFTLTFTVFPNLFSTSNSVKAATSLNLTDQKASKNTKALFAYLRDIRGNHILFGQQHANDT